MDVDAARRWTDLLHRAGFRSEDLDANRQGKLAPGQPSRAWGTSLAFAGLIAGAAAVVGFGGAIQAILVGQYFFAVLLFMIGTGASTLLIAYQMDVRSPLRQADGTLTKVMRGVGEFERYALLVNAIRFRLPRRAFDLIPAGGPYRVYYTQRFKFLVNLEPLPGWQSVSQ